LSLRRFTEDLHGETAYQGFAIEADLYNTQSAYQHIEIVKTQRFGRALILDGIVQTTELDEFMYHEMLVHVPILACDSPQNILIIGGGDGGSLREALKHNVKRVDMIEIDEAVINSCIEYLPTLNNAGAVYEDPRANLILEDAFTYLKREKCSYDVIISDSTDPVGPGEILFSKEFYQCCKAALKSTGALSLQNGVAFLQPNEARDTRKTLRGIGLLAKCYQVTVPTYYGGPMVMGFGTRDPRVFNPSLQHLTRGFDRISAPLRHYTPAHHLASFVLPRWIQELTGRHDDSPTS